MDVLNTEKTIRAKLVALAIEGEYTIYVFENFAGGYITTTRLPNWEAPELKLGDIGYLVYKEVEAGKDTWYNIDTNQHITYSYSEIYFRKFIFDNKRDDIILD